VAHNLAVPDGCFQINPSPAAAIWQGEGDEQSLSAHIDTSAVWNPPVRVARRSISSPRPDLIEIVDEFELDEARHVTFYLNSPLPIGVEGTMAFIQGKKARLSVEAAWAASASAGEYYCNFVYQPYNRLCLTSSSATRHTLKTILRFTALT
jgi:hypothetical protein